MDNVHWVWVVLQSLAHLMPVCCQDQTVNNQVLEEWLAKEGSGHKQSAECNTCTSQWAQEMVIRFHAGWCGCVHVCAILHLIHSLDVCRM